MCAIILHLKISGGIQFKTATAPFVYYQKIRTFFCSKLLT